MRGGPQGSQGGMDSREGPMGASDGGHNMQSLRQILSIGDGQASQQQVTSTPLATNNAVFEDLGEVYQVLLQSILIFLL